MEPAISVSMRRVRRWGHNTKSGQDNDDFYDAQDAADEAEQVLLRAIRGDLAIPDD